MALRNRRHLGAAALAHLMDQAPHEPVQVLCLGAGPGNIITDAMLKSRKNVQATLVDISSDPFDYGRQLAQRCGLADRMRFIQGDIRDVAAMSAMLDGHKPDVVKMLGICEYLSDEQLVGIVQAVSAMMPPRSAIVFNDISLKHGTDRFFRRVLGLHMIYRDRTQLEALFARGGFGGFTAVAEPLGVYHIVIGRKT
jgi:cyclopropane fatty-acyl-phospholipid synthase-like methyltransferase